jgi:hypothetical protein
MIEEHIDGQSCHNVFLIYPPRQPAPVSKKNTTTWDNHNFGSVSRAGLVQNETVPSPHSAQFSVLDSLASDDTLAAYDAQAQYRWQFASRICEPMPNFASISSLASTVTSSTTCAYPSLPAAPSFGLAPSFDFTRLGVQHHALFENPTYSHGINHVSSMDSLQLSVGSGYDLDAQEPSTIESNQLEEYSLGPGYPG